MDIAKNPTDYAQQLIDLGFTYADYVAQYGHYTGYSELVRQAMLELGDHTAIVEPEASEEVSEATEATEATEAVTHQAFEKACHRLINSVWTVTFRKVSSHHVEILAYNREDEDGYKFESLMPHARVVENDNRIVTGLTINGTEYTVENPKHIFSYN